MKRIGPHNKDIVSLIVGSTLGDSHLEKRAGGIGTRVIFEQSSKNVEYLMWFHNYFSDRGYCNPKKPKLFGVVSATLLQRLDMRVKTMGISLVSIVGIPSMSRLQM